MVRSRHRTLGGGDPGFGPLVDEGAVALGDPQHAIAGDVPCGGAWAVEVAIDALAVGRGE